MIIRFGEKGKSLGTRDDGRKFRAQIIEGVRGKELVTFANGDTVVL